VTFNGRTTVNMPNSHKTALSEPAVTNLLKLDQYCRQQNVAQGV